MQNHEKYVGQQPILWTFRRCPYAMRARLALHYAQVHVDEREMLLRDKPEAFLQVSSDGTVPVLQLEQSVVQESLDIMRWAFVQGGMSQLAEQDADEAALISLCDGAFKCSLDRVKYASRYPECDVEEERRAAYRILDGYNVRLAHSEYLFGAKLGFSDLAVAPFVRQFAQIDRAQFEAGAGKHLRRWLIAFEQSDAFAVIMEKRPVWTP